MEITQIADSQELAQLWKEKQKEEAVKMRNTMELEGGLLTIKQASLLLEVSNERINALMKIGKLTRYEFMEHVYLSFRQVYERRQQDLKAGRPPRSAIQRLKVVAQVMGATTGHQLRHGNIMPGDPEKFEQKKKIKK